FGHQQLLRLLIPDLTSGQHIGVGLHQIRLDRLSPIGMHPPPQRPEAGFHLLPGVSRQKLDQRTGGNRRQLRQFRIHIPSPTSDTLLVWYPPAPRNNGGFTVPRHSRLAASFRWVSRPASGLRPNRRRYALSRSKSVTFPSSYPPADTAR